MPQPAFGRRTAPPADEPAPRQVFGRAQPLDLRKPRDEAVIPAEMPARSLETAPAEPERSVEEELEEWKRARRFPIPWRQLTLMATLCFGAATLVLPDDVAEPVQWLLYLLTAASMASTVAAWWKKLTHVV